MRFSSRKLNKEMEARKPSGKGTAGPNNSFMEAIAGWQNTLALIPDRVKAEVSNHESIEYHHVLRTYSICHWLLRLCAHLHTCLHLVSHV